MFIEETSEISYLLPLSHLLTPIQGISTTWKLPILIFCLVGINPGLDIFSLYI